MFCSRSYLLPLLLLLASVCVTAQGTAPVELVGARSPKILYDLGEPVTGTVTVKNPDAVAHAVVVRAWLEYHLEDRTNPQEVQLQVPPGKTATAAFRWTKLPDQFGYALKAQLLERDRVVGAGEDYFQISDNYWKVAIIGIGTGSGNDVANLDSRVQSKLAELRQGYYNGFENFFWAPDEVVAMNPTQDSWYSSAGHYPESRLVTQRFNALAHEQGLKAIVYERYSGGGSAGAEAARRHPEWIAQSEGTLAIDRQIRQLEEWDREQPTNFRGWAEIRENLSRPEVLAASVQGLVDSVIAYGWDGARWDGTYSEPTEWYNLDGTLGAKLTPEQADAKTAEDFRRYKEAVSPRFPHFVYADNYWGLDAALQSVPRETGELCRGGGLVMNEWIRGSHDTGAPLHRWDDYGRFLVEDTDRAKRLGGYYGPILDLNEKSADGRYKCVFALAAGAHPYYATLWGAFITRYSYYLWDPALTPLAVPEPYVTAPDTVWWKHWVFERNLAGGRKQLVVHLINPPVHPLVGDGPALDDLPTPVKEVTVQLLPSLTADWRPVRVTCLSPEPQLHDQLALTDTGAGVQAIAVPEVDLWDILVIDLEARKGGR